MSLRLEPIEQSALTKLLAANYPDVFTLQPFLKARLNKDINRITNIVGLGGWDFKVMRVVERANAELWWRRLTAAALADHPDDEDLATFACEHGIVTAGVKVDESHAPVGSLALESLVTKTRFQDLAAMTRQLVKLQGQICRVAVKLDRNVKCGTGFLVGPDRVMTNFHVLREFINGKVDAGEVGFRFDYITLPNGEGIADGDLVRPAGPAADSVLAQSEYDEKDVKDPAESLNQAWPHNRLDYAIVRLARPIGNESPGPWGDEGPQVVVGVKRGWLKPAVNWPMPDRREIFIVQHPVDYPMSIAFQSDAYLGSDQAHQRVRYRTNTLGGSSGSPCLDESWNWVALHHAGDPKWIARFNQGIPVDAIVKHLEDVAKRPELLKT